VINLPTANYEPSSLAVDSRQHRIFLSSNKGLMVLGPDGTLVKAIDVPANALTLSSDGRTLYSAGDTISAIDTAGLTVTAQYAIGAGYRIEALTPMVVTAGRIWFEGMRTDSAGQHFLIGSFDLRSPKRPARYTEVPFQPTELGASPSAPDTLVAAGNDAKDNVSYLDVFHACSCGSLKKTAQRLGWVQHLAITPDGKYVVTTQQGAFRLRDLAKAFSYDTSGYNAGIVSIASDGLIALQGERNDGTQAIFLFGERGGAPRRVLKLDQVGFGSLNGLNSVWALGWTRGGTKLYDTFLDKPVGFPNIALRVFDLPRGCGALLP